jgi:carbonic anhydrase
MMMQPTSSPTVDPHAVASTHDPITQAVHAAPHHLPPAVPPVVTVEEALTELKKGNERHTDSDYNHDHHSHRRLEEVAKGQKPHAIILTCSDSRVPPELLFDKGLGDLFVIRVAGNIAGASELASIEYAAEHLNVPLVIVMGHKRCGAVQAAAAGGDAGGHIAALVRQIEPAVQKARNLPGDLVDNAVHTNIDQVVRDLRNSDPILKELVAAGRLKVLGAYYDIDTGKVDWMY